MFCFQNKSSNVITLLNTSEYSLRFKPKVVTRVGWITYFFGRCYFLDMAEAEIFKCETSPGDDLLGILAICPEM